MRKKGLFITILFLAIAFALVSTTLYINGSIKLNIDESFDGNVYFSDAQMVDPTTVEKGDVEVGGYATIETDPTEMTVVTGNLSALNNTSTVNYTITNENKNYDAQAKIVCEPDSTDPDDIANFENLVTVVNSDAKFTIPASGTYDGVLTVTLIASALGDTGEGVDVPFKCSIEAYGTERESVGNGTAEVTQAP